VTRACERPVALREGRGVLTSADLTRRVGGDCCCQRCPAARGRTLPRRGGNRKPLTCRGGLPSPTDGYRFGVTALPKPRGRLSEGLLAGLSDLPVAAGDLDPASAESAEDAALALWVLHELSYRGFDDVDDGAERDPELHRLRCLLEDDLEQRLRERWPGPPDADLATDFFDWVGGHDGPSLARHVQTEASEEQVLDLLRIRSVYHLKEADPTSWVIPRLTAGPKAALVELLYDEYGAGDPGRLHHELFARGMEASGLRPEYGAYVDEAPAEVLEQNNALSAFGLQRRLRAAALGHLAAFEATSSLPSRRMAQGLGRLGFPSEMVAYYTEHVVADAVHEQVALRDVCVRLVAQEPALEPDVWFGAWACLDLEDRTARRLLTAWGVPA